MKSSDLAECAACACRNLRSTTRVVTRRYDDYLRPSGLQITQFTLLVTIALAEPITITQLAELAVMDRTTLTRNLKPLEKQQWVEAEAGIDQRLRVVKLTPSGYEKLAQALPLWQQAQAQTVAALGQERFDSLLVDLEALTTQAS